MMSASLVFGETQPRAWLERLDPRLKLFWLLWISTLSITLDSVGALALLFAASMIGPSGLRMRRRGWLLIGALLAAVAWGTLLSQALFYAQMPRTVLLTLIPAGNVAGWEFPGLHLYREGTTYGLMQSLRMLAVTLGGLSVCLSTSPDRLLAALARLRVPVAIGFITVTALRFLPVVTSELSSAWKARHMRGYRRSLWPKIFGGDGVARGVTMETRLLLPVLAASLRRAETLATSVTSRGFDPTAKRTFYPELRLRRGEWLVLLGLGFAWMAVVGTKLLWWFYVAEIYYHPSLRGLYDLARRWL